MPKCRRHNDTGRKAHYRRRSVLGQANARAAQTEGSSPRRSGPVIFCCGGVAGPGQRGDPQQPGLPGPGSSLGTVCLTDMHRRMREAGPRPHAWERGGD